jgi:hypothetical protein
MLTLNSLHGVVWILKRTDQQAEKEGAQLLFDLFHAACLESNNLDCFPNFLATCMLAKCHWWLQLFKKLRFRM